MVPWYLSENDIDPKLSPDPLGEVSQVSPPSVVRKILPPQPPATAYSESMTATQKGLCSMAGPPATVSHAGWERLELLMKKNTRRIRRGEMIRNSPDRGEYGARPRDE